MLDSASDLKKGQAMKRKKNKLNLEKKKHISQNQISFSDHLSDISRAFYSQFPDSMDEYFWTVETFSDHIIVEVNREFYRVGYSGSQNDITFDERDDWVQVATVWVEVEPVHSDIKSGIVNHSKMAIKALGGNRLGGYAAIWGDADTPDFHGEWFDSETSEMDSIFKSVGKLPFLYDHAMDGAIKTSVVGLVDVLESDDIGLWYEAQLDKANEYIDAIQQLSQKGVLGTSSGTLSGALNVEKSGRIARWPIVEISATTTPADPRQRTERPINELKSIFESIGLDLDISADSNKGKETAEPKAAKKTAASVMSEVEKAKLLLEIDIMEIEA